MMVIDYVLVLLTLCWSAFFVLDWRRTRKRRLDWIRDDAAIERLAQEREQRRLNMEHNRRINRILCQQREPVVIVANTFAPGLRRPDKERGH